MVFSQILFSQIVAVDLSVETRMLCAKVEFFQNRLTKKDLQIECLIESVLIINLDILANLMYFFVNVEHPRTCFKENQKKIFSQKILSKVSALFWSAFFS